jgi:ABC-2 type transport system permease protein
MRELLAGVREEFKRIFSNDGARTTMVVAVLIYAVFYPQPYLNEAVRKVPVVVVDQDHSATSRELIRRIDASDGAAVIAAAQDVTTGRDGLLAGRASAMVVIPTDFERNILAGRPSPIATYGDAGYFLIYRAAVGAIAAAARSVDAEIAVRRLNVQGVEPAAARAMVDPMPVTIVPLFNPQGGYATYVVPTAFVLILQQTLMMGIGLLGPLRMRSATGHQTGSRIVAVLARAVAYVALYLPFAVLYLVIMPHLYHLPRLGSVGDLLTVMVVFLFAVSFLGLTLAALMPSGESVILMLVVLGLPLFFLSGVSWPTESMPTSLSMAAQCIPSIPAMNAAVRIGQMGASLADVASELRTLGVDVGGYAVAAVVSQIVRDRRELAIGSQTPPSASML